ncbi:metallophosphoesterase [Aestuariibacter halophilus]|uniref:Metallophosphoesterase n=1 Tax=Fluctibacter halophilus TaxID=226011 RepID=A0ABS8G888_9ALTE|nr:metallophosphoesterase [Aestuariibacter halophilus]MCC2616311.1 metallophosphoesterase [Aestuariibacter halophilus]
MLKFFWLALLPSLITFSSFAGTAPQDASDKIVVVGDIHGDFEQFTCVLRQAGLINSRMRWTGKNATLVQMGDIVDRGPDSRKIIDLLRKLKSMARRAKGDVYALIGNHEAMLIAADTRYTHPGEYKAFVNSRSKRKQHLYFDLYIEHMKKTQPEESWPDYESADYIRFLEMQFPLGYVEYMQAWAPKGDYGAWASSNPAVLKIGRLLFVHGGMGPTTQNYTITEINQWIQSELGTREQAMKSDVLNDPNGPLWYRGHILASEDDPAERKLITDVLERYEVDHVIVGHTPVAGAILPRFDGTVIGVDVGLADYYGGPCAFLEITGKQLTAVHNGNRIDLPSPGNDVGSYLHKVLSLDSENETLKSYIQQLENPETKEPVIESDKLN